MPIEDYKVCRRIAEGRFGTVFAATKISTGERVAIKKIRARKNLPGLDFDPWYKSAERERDVLSCLKHTSVIELMEHMVVAGASTAYLIYPYLAWDLATVLQKKHPLREAQGKAFMLMLLQGVSHLHSQRVVHRDLKPPNLLVGSSGQLKIADFGSARFLPHASPRSASQLESADGLMTRDVCTRWYKAPEMLFGSVDYSLGVDLWALGCILAELLSVKAQPLFPGGADLEQLCFIFQAVGTPNEDDWPEVRQLPDYCKVAFKTKEPEHPDLGPNASVAAADLVWGLLQLNPRHRTSADEALDHDFIISGCSPDEPGSLLQGLVEDTGHHHHEVNEGPMTPVGVSDPGSDGSDFSFLVSDDFEPVRVETTACGLWEQATLEEQPPEQGAGGYERAVTPPGRRTPSPPSSGIHRLKR